MDFEDYIACNLGSHKDDLSKEQLTRLKKIYDKLLIWQNAASIAKNKKESEKVSNHINENAKELAKVLDEIKSSFGIE